MDNEESDESQNVFSSSKRVPTEVVGPDVVDSDVESEGRDNSIIKVTKDDIEAMKEEYLKSIEPLVKSKAPNVKYFTKEKYSRLVEFFEKSKLYHEKYYQKHKICKDLTVKLQPIVLKQLDRAEGKVVEDETVEEKMKFDSAKVEREKISQLERELSSITMTDRHGKVEKEFTMPQMWMKKKKWINSYRLVVEKSNSTNNIYKFNDYNSSGREKLKMKFYHTFPETDFSEKIYNIEEAFEDMFEVYTEERMSEGIEKQKQPWTKARVITFVQSNFPSLTIEVAQKFIKSVNIVLERINPSNKEMDVKASIGNVYTPPALSFSLREESEEEEWDSEELTEGADGREEKRKSYVTKSSKGKNVEDTSLPSSQEEESEEGGEGDELTGGDGSDENDKKYYVTKAARGKVETLLSSFEEESEGGEDEQLTAEGEEGQEYDEGDDEYEKVVLEESEDDEFISDEKGAMELSWSFSSADPKVDSRFGGRKSTSSKRRADGTNVSDETNTFSADYEGNEMNKTHGTKDDRKCDNKHESTTTAIHHHFSSSSAKKTVPQSFHEGKSDGNYHRSEVDVKEYIANLDLNRGMWSIMSMECVFISCGMHKAPDHTSFSYISCTQLGSQYIQMSTVSSITNTAEVVEAIVQMLSNYGLIPFRIVLDRDGIVFNPKRYDRETLKFEPNGLIDGDEKFIIKRGGLLDDVFGNKSKVRKHGRRSS